MLCQKKLLEITAKRGYGWQNEMRTLMEKNGELYSETFLKTIHNQVSAIFCHALRYYDLLPNPAAKAENMAYRYAYLFPSKQTEMATHLNIQREGGF